MKCPKCQAENPEGMKFCGECGAKLERICPNCNFPNPPQFKFCGECGHQLIAFEGWIFRYIGEILLNIDDQHLSQAEHWVQEAIEADRRNGMMFELGRAYALYADLFKRKEDRLKTRKNLGRAIEILKECGADGWVSKYEKELAALS